VVCPTAFLTFFLLSSLSSLTFTQADLDTVAAASGGRVDVTVGSALDIFGGDLAFEEVVAWSRRQGGGGPA